MKRLSRTRTVTLTIGVLGFLFLMGQGAMADEVKLVDDTVTSASGSTPFAPSCGSVPPTECLNGSDPDACPVWFPLVTDASFRWSHDTGSADLSQATRAELVITAFDIDSDERHEVSLNGTYIGRVPGGNENWDSLTVDLDPALLRSGTNEITVASSGPRGRRVAFCRSHLVVYGEEVDLKVKVTPPKREVGCGEAATVQYNVNIQGLAGSAQLSVDGLPSGVSAAFKENPVTPPGGGSTADTKLVITRTGDTAEGSHTLTISAKAGAAESSDRVTLKTRDCIDPQGSFSLTANPPERTIQASESTDYSVTAAFDAGYSGTVWLSIAGLPKGATALFDPKRLSPSGVKRSQLEIITDGSTPEGSYPLIITGDDGELKRTVTVMLNVVSTVESGFDLYIEPDEVELQPGETGEAEISTDFFG